ncbi:MAG: enoyl-CoA hydratase-related protein, partial [Gammaproteobacteria bacterium]|nr:enoyl-CoA hydratase-related protein [Gammaproteobacteria bacterium]
ELMFTGRSFTAEEALSCGLINKVVPRDQLESEVMEMAQNIARNPSDAISLGKAAFELGLDILGVGAGYTGGYIHHVLATNIRYEEDEFNLFKARRDSGVSNAIKSREKRFGKKGLSREKTDSQK